MIQVNWMAATSVVVIGALLTALLSYVVATVGRGSGHRSSIGTRENDTRTRELSGGAAAERRPAA